MHKASVICKVIEGSLQATRVTFTVKKKSASYFCKEDVQTIFYELLSLSCTFRQSNYPLRRDPQPISIIIAYCNSINSTDVHNSTGI